MKRLLTLIFLALLMAGCASSRSGDTYSRDEAKRAMNVQEGTLIGARLVKLEGTKSGVGTVSGAVAGGIGGSGIGAGRGSAVAAVVGAVVGGVIGAAVEEGVTREQAWELTIELDGGRKIVVVQGAGEDKFVAGERVRVIQGGGSTRVSH